MNALSTSIVKWVKKVAGLAVAAILIVFLMLYLNGRFHEKAPVQGSPASRNSVGDAQLAAVRMMTIPATESAVGTIRPVYESQVASRILEKVIEVNITAGQQVTKGQVLVRLEDAVLQSQLRKAQSGIDGATATFNQARIEFDSTKKLYEQKVAAKNEYDRVDAALKTAQADLERARQEFSQAQTALEYATIRAPSDGIVVDKKVNVGDTVQPGTVLLTLYDPTRMQMIASVRESLAQRLKVGQAIGVHIDTLGADCKGSISEIVPESQSASRSFLVKVTGPCRPGVYAGMYGSLDVPLDEEKVLVMPQAAVVRVGQLDMVQLAQGGHLERRAVQLGRHLTIQGQPMVEVLSGLSEGQQVAVSSGATSRKAGE